MGFELIADLANYTGTADLCLIRSVPLGPKQTGEVLEQLLPRATTNRVGSETKQRTACRTCSARMACFGLPSLGSV